MPVLPKGGRSRFSRNPSRLGVEFGIGDAAESGICGDWSEVLRVAEKSCGYAPWFAIYVMSN